MKPEAELDKLFTLYDDIRKAEIAHDTSLEKIKINDALVQSCVFLSNLVDDLVIQKEPPELSALSVDRGSTEKLGNGKVLEQFIAIESKLLVLAGIRQPLIDQLTEAIGFIYTKKLPVVSWHDNLMLLKDEVCREATASSERLKHMPFIKRVIVAGGGVVVGTLNIVTPGIPPDYRLMSTSTAAYMLGLSMEFMKDYLNKP